MYSASRRTLHTGRVRYPEPAATRIPFITPPFPQRAFHFPATGYDRANFKPNERTPPMGLMDFIKGQLLEVIEWTDDSRDTLSYRFPDGDKEIKRGAQLIVQESQVAQFVYLGEFGDTYNSARANPRSSRTTSPCSRHSSRGSSVSSRPSRRTSITSSRACSPATSGGRRTR